MLLLRWILPHLARIGLSPCLRYNVSGRMRVSGPLLYQTRTTFLRSYMSVSNKSHPVSVILFDFASDSLHCRVCAHFSALLLPMSHHFYSLKLESSIIFPLSERNIALITREIRPSQLLLAAFNTFSTLTHPTNLSAAGASKSRLFNSISFCSERPSRGRRHIDYLWPIARIKIREQICA